MPKKSKKQRELELEAARAEKKEELILECGQSRKILEDMGWIEGPEGFDEEACVERKLKEWEETQRLDPTGKFQDRRKIESEYQYHFARYIQECCPNVIEELRHLSPLFSSLFGDDKNKFHIIFDPLKTEFLFGLQDSLQSTINFSVLKHRFLSFRPGGRDINAFRYDYHAGENRALWLFLHQLVVSHKTDIEGYTSYRRVKEYLERHLHVEINPKDLPADFDSSLVPKFISKQAEDAILELMTNDDEHYFTGPAKERIREFLKEFSKAEDSDIEAFIQLQLALLDWANKNNLEKDWLLRYGYFFLSRFSENPDIKVSDIQVLQLDARSLVGFPFNFEFNNWLPGEESREAYEIRLRASFEIALSWYFHTTARQLKTL